MGPELAGPLDREGTLQDVTIYETITSTKTTGTNITMATTQTTNTTRAVPRIGVPQGGAEEPEVDTQVTDLTTDQIQITNVHTWPTTPQMMKIV